MSKEGKGIEIGRLKELIRARSKAGANLGYAERRRQMDANAEQFPVPAGVEVLKADLGGLGAEWNVPSGAATAPVILYFHGGGYVQGSSVSHRHLTSRLALAAKALAACRLRQRQRPRKPLLLAGRRRALEAAYLPRQQPQRLPRHALSQRP